MKNYKMKNEGQPGINDGHDAGPSLLESLTKEELEARKIESIKARNKAKKNRDSNAAAREETAKKRILVLKDAVPSKKNQLNPDYDEKGFYDGIKNQIAKIKKQYGLD